MKKIFLSLLIISLGISVTSQQLTKQDYLQKSKNQKTTGWLLLGGGTAIAVGASIWAVNNLFGPDQGEGVLLVAGVCAMAGSIPFFIAASRNKRKAMEMAVNFKVERSVAVQTIRKGFTYYPAVSFTIQLK